MTDRVNGLTVILEHDIRIDDVEELMGIIRCLRGVLSVQPLIADFEAHMAEERARRQLGQKLLDVLYPKKSGS